MDIWPVCFGSFIVNALNYFLRVLSGSSKHLFISVGCRSGPVHFSLKKFKKSMGKNL